MLNYQTLLIDICISLTRKLVKGKLSARLSKPWITFGIRKSLKIKNNLHRKFIKSQSVCYYSKVKLYGNKLNHLIRIIKINYYNNYFRHNKSHINNSWKGIKEIISFKPLRNSIQSKVVDLLTIM
jgi:queuine/archaeosine tRNA-ribosyltransferase